MGDHASAFIQDNTTHPIFVTIQPNFCRAPSPIRVSPGTPGTPANKAWALVRTLFFRADRDFTGCVRAACLPPEARFQGIAVLEKHATNPHPHILLSCRDEADQIARSDFLLEALDNVAKSRKDVRDEQWQRERWELILEAPARADDLLRDRTYSLLTDLAPAGTAMVQVVRTDEDLDKVCRYMTKTWFQTQHQLARLVMMPADDAFMDWKLLREFHASVDASRAARQYRFDRRSGESIAGIAGGWKARGRILRK